MNNPIKNQKTVIKLFSKHLNKKVVATFYTKDIKKKITWKSSWSILNKYDYETPSTPETIVRLERLNNVDIKLTFISKILIKLNILQVNNE